MCHDLAIIAAWASPVAVALALFLLPRSGVAVWVDVGLAGRAWASISMEILGAR